MRVLIAFSLLAVALTAQAQLYRWTDESGKVHYTDTPPPASAKNVEKKFGPCWRRWGRLGRAAILCAAAGDKKLPGDYLYIQRLR